jgi:hypothetical protein
MVKCLGTYNLGYQTHGVKIRKLHVINVEMQQANIEERKREKDVKLLLGS